MNVSLAYLGVASALGVYIVFFSSPSQSTNGDGFGMASGMSSQTYIDPTVNTDIVSAPEDTTEFPTAPDDLQLLPVDSNSNRKKENPNPTLTLPPAEKARKWSAVLKGLQAAEEKNEHAFLARLRTQPAVLFLEFKPFEQSVRRCYRMWGRIFVVRLSAIENELGTDSFIHAGSWPYLT